MAVCRFYNSSNMASNITRFSLCDIDLNVEFTPLPDLNFDAEEIFSHEEAEEFNNDIGIAFVHLCAFSFVTFVTLLKFSYSSFFFNAYEY
jgi:hypothetical protein